LPFEIVAEHDGSSAVVHARRIVLATGARELFIPFPGWTLPGVVGVGGAQALLKAGTSFRGKRVVIAGSGPLLLPVAASLATRGARLAIVAEQTPREAVVSFVSGLWRSPSLLAQAAQYRARFASTRYATGTWVTEAHGREHVTAVTLTDGRRTWREDADVLCTGYGLVPSVELARVLGCDVRDDAVVVDDIQQTSVAGVYAAGEVTGVGGAPLALIEGEIAGTAATARHVAVGSLMHRRDALRASARRMRATFAPRAELRACVTPDTIVCRCEDVTLAAVSHAPNARAAKLYTRAGMGPCQGRTCAPALSFLCGWAPDTVRSPVEPAPISVLATDSTSSDSGATS
jgi:NADPH-dependent 2,4-dienoyl-CoA reductase/sulfur reductase-like enzyme